ncbi:MAG: hypothetical protein ACRC6U_04825 [Fusobacteriaceae bacterium]
MKKLFTVMFSLFLVILTGCSSTVPNKRFTGPYHSKNYELNKPKSVYVGEELLKVTTKEYASLIELPTFISQENIRISALAGNEIDTISAGQKFTSSFTTLKDGKSYYMLKIKNKADTSGLYSTALLYLEKNTLTLQNRALSIIKLPIRISNNVPFKQVENTIEFSDLNGLLKYDIIYNGISGDTIKFSYREFTADNLARPAFYQELNYNKKDRIIRFKKIEIEILKLTNSEITYKVIKDGMEN